jgi:ATP-binding cassette, subfamily B, multidrug efflux pump
LSAHHGGGHPGGGQLPSTFDADKVMGNVYDSTVVRRLIKYLGPVKSDLGLGVAGMVMRSVSTVALPMLVGMATDSLIGDGDLARLNMTILIVIGVVSLGWAGRYLEELFLGYVGQKVLYRVRTQMFDHLQRLSLRFFDQNKVGRIMSRVQSDVQQIQELLASGMLNVVFSALTLIAIAAVMLVMNTHLALLTLTVVPALAAVTFVWQRHARQAFVKVRRAIATVNAQLQEA